jgi:hypothetical protein
MSNPNDHLATVVSTEHPEEGIDDLAETLNHRLIDDDAPDWICGVSSSSSSPRTCW